MKAVLAGLACLSLLTAAVGAQVRPQPGPGDRRLQTVFYDPGQVVELRTAPGYQLTVELSPDEQVQNVAVGDTGAWQVTANKAGDHLFLRTTQPGAVTNMTVITSARVYNFDLIALGSPAADMAYTIRFTYPAATEADASSPSANAAPAVRPASGYRIEGDRALRPTIVSDDGVHTFITWPADSALPATFQIGDDGQERLVNGSMRGNRFVIDGIAKKLVFRIDQRTATATRQLLKKRR